MPARNVLILPQVLRGPAPDVGLAAFAEPQQRSKWLWGMWLQTRNCTRTELFLTQRLPYLPLLCLQLLWELGSGRPSPQPWPFPVPAAAPVVRCGRTTATLLHGPLARIGGGDVSNLCCRVSPSPSVPVHRCLPQHMGMHWAL